jgi:hypothetical protein
VVNRSDRATESPELTKEVKRLVHPDSDVAVSDIMVDELDVVTDQTVSSFAAGYGTGKFRSLVDVHAHKVWVK